MPKQAFQTKRGTIYWFDPEALIIEDDKTHPFYDARAEMPVNEKMVESMKYKNQGVLMAVIIKKDGMEPVVVDGRRRVKAARQANIELKEEGKEPLKVPCIYRRGDDLELFGVTISANEHRVDDGPLEKADKLNKFLNGGGDIDEAHIIFGVSKVTIDNWLKLLDLDRSVKKEIRAGNISASAAATLHKLPKSEQKEKVKTLISTGATSTARAQRAVQTGKTNTVKKCRGRKEIEDFLSKWEKSLPRDAVRALRWVMREEENIIDGELETNE